MAESAPSPERSEKPTLGEQGVSLGGKGRWRFPEAPLSPWQNTAVFARQIAAPAASQARSPN